MMTALFEKPKTKWDPQPLLYQLFDAPVRLLATTLYDTLVRFRPLPRPKNPAIKIVLISDTHTQQRELPDGDLLIHAGDLASSGSVSEIQAQIDWLSSLSFTHKIVIAGNHDTYLDPRSRRTLQRVEKLHDLDWKSINYLQHSSIELRFPQCGDRTLKIYGAPQIPACGGPSFAFQYTREDDAWSNTIPKTDILVTHTPPFSHLDLPNGLGCMWLLEEIWRVRPRLHVFGHVHAGHGQSLATWDQCQRAYEHLRVLQHERSRTLSSLISVVRDLLTMICSGFLGLLWCKLWGGASQCTILINAALMSPKTGRIDQDVQIVEL